MDANEPVIVKSVTNEAFFGEPGVIRAIVERFVPYIIGQPDREVLFIHHKNPEAETSIAITIMATASSADQALAQATVQRLIDLPKLTYEVTFAQIDDTREASFDTIVAALEARASLNKYTGFVELSVARDAEARRQAALHEAAMFERLSVRPMPWEVRPGSAQDQELRYVVDTLMSIGRDALDS